ERDPGGARRRRLRMKPQHRGSDDAERAFGAEKELLQVVAGVVLAQAAQPFPHAAIGQHNLQAQHLVARAAVTEHVDAAGVGGEIAADLAAAFGGERQREEPARIVRGGLYCADDGATTYGDRYIMPDESSHG